MSNEPIQLLLDLSNKKVCRLCPLVQLQYLCTGCCRLNQRHHSSSLWSLKSFTAMPSFLRDLALRLASSAALSAGSRAALFPTIAATQSPRFPLDWRARSYAIASSCGDRRQSGKENKMNDTLFAEETR